MHCSSHAKELGILRYISQPAAFLAFWILAAICLTRAALSAARRPSSRSFLRSLSAAARRRPSSVSLSRSNTACGQRCGSRLGAPCNHLCLPIKDDERSYVKFEQEVGAAGRL